MEFIKKSPVYRGQFKCFQCRTLTKCKDGSWHESAEKQVFLCKICEKASTPKN